MFRPIVILLSVICGAIIGLQGGMAFFEWIDPNPSPATQAGMAYGLIIFLLITPVCAASAGILAAILTKRRK